MSVTPSPPVLGVLAHDLRWAIVGLLVPGDLRTGEIVARTGQAPSLVSYHLARLRDAGLVSVRRSTADGRDSYHALDLDAIGRAVGDMAARIHPSLLEAAVGWPGAGADPGPGAVPGSGSGSVPGSGPVPGPVRGSGPVPGSGPALGSGPVPGSGQPVRALFICSGNSARSPMAAGWLNHLGGGRVTARSAGVSPGPLHPLAVAAMAEHGVDISGHRPTHLSDVADGRFTRVITLCDRARENCGDLPGPAAHWSIPNPAQAHPADLDAFRATARELRTRIRYLLPALAEGAHDLQ
jgi:ArsR family transcriptional regulator, arsenate/arsenite/antimonite-responsive transcriptional repressor / arsenate reductase (thioredoxin)